MSNKNNVIPFRSTNKNTVGSPEGPKNEAKKGPRNSGELIDMTQRRRDQIATERRVVTRTVMSQFIGVFVVLPQTGLQPVSLYDISESGLSFDLPQDLGSFTIGEAVTLRIYLSHDTYFSFSAKVKNVRSAQAEGIRRHGAVFKKNDQSFKTLFFFAKFLENVSLVARKDTGDRLLGRID